MQHLLFSRNADDTAKTNTAAIMCSMQGLQQLKVRQQHTFLNSISRTPCCSVHYERWPWRKDTLRCLSSTGEATMAERMQLLSHARHL